MIVVKLMVTLLVGVLLVLFGAQNAQPVSLKFFSWESTDVPLVLALGLALFVGAILCALLAAPGLLSGWREHRPEAPRVEPLQTEPRQVEAQQAVVREEDARLEAEREAQKEIQRAAEGVAADPTKSGAHTGSDKGAISLKQRVVPFIDMLRRAHAEDKDIVWGV